jgi:hypothetical protein
MITNTNLAPFVGTIGSPVAGNPIIKVAVAGLFVVWKQIWSPSQFEASCLKKK